LQQLEARFSLLQKIDSAILSPSVSVDQIIADVIRQLTSAIDATAVSIFLDAGDFLELLVSTSVRQRHSLPNPNWDSDHSTSETDLRSTPDDVFLKRLGSASAILARIHGVDRSPLGYLVVEWAAQIDGQTTQDVCDFVAAVAQQLSLAIQFKEERRLEHARWELVREFLDHHLKPSRGFDIVCRRLPSFLPAFQPLVIDPPPMQQILLYAPPDEYLTVAATTGEEGVNTRVFVKNSVCGRLISDPTPLNIDPLEDPLYRPYLGKNMRSELALRVDLGNGVLAIVNVETAMVRAFKQVHVQALERGLDQLRPVLSGLNARRSLTHLQQRALLFSVGNHLESLAKAFSHDLSNSLAPARLLVEEIIASVIEPNHELKVRSAELIGRIETIDAQRKQLAEDIRGFSNDQPRQVSDLMRSATLLVWPNQNNRQNLELTETFDSGAYVYCSLFLKEIFANLLQNSAYWVGQRMLEEHNFQGRIDMQISRERQQDALGGSEQGLNEKVRIAVRDNGLGMHSDQLDNVFERDFTLRKDGTGYGLFAAKEYVTSIGGEIQVDSKPNTFFEVQIILDQYDPRLHARDNILAEETAEQHLPLPTAPEATY
jgi:signal transduction histidine kinase